MADDVSPNACDAEGYGPMCCNSENGVCYIQPFGSITLDQDRHLITLALQGSGINACKPFEEVKEKYYKSFGYNKGDETQAEYIEDALS
jgi:hypothetical protein